MSTSKKTDVLRYQPPSTQNHHRQTLRQIWLPLAGAILIVVIVAVFATVGSANNARNGLHWANISLIFMIIPTMLIGLIYLIILAALAFGVIKLRDILPLYAYQAQAFLYRVAIAIRHWADRSTQPIMTVKSWSSGWNAVKSSLFGTPPSSRIPKG